MRRSGSGAGCGVPRSCLASTLREAGVTVRALLRGLCLQWLDGSAKGGGNPAGVAMSHVLARKYGPLAINPAVARSQAPRFHREMDRVPTTIPAPVGAPPPLVVSRGDLPQTSGALRRENAEAWLFDIRIGIFVGAKAPVASFPNASAAGRSGRTTTMRSIVGSACT
jgi:hypothetical protein